MKSTKFKPAMIVYAIFALLMAIQPSAFAALDTSDTTSNLCDLFKSIETILNVVSVTVVTIAIIFSGYQIAFAHKRFADVAPVLIGALLIGAASQIATMLLPNGGCTTAAVQMIQIFA